MKQIFFVKNKEGRYLNYKDGKNPFFVDSIISATPSDKRQEVPEGLEVEAIDLEDFKLIYSTTVSELIIIGELFHRKAKHYHDTIPVLPKLNKDTRNAVKNAILKLSFFHSQADEIIKHGQEDELYDVSADFEELVNHLSDAFKGDVAKFNEVFRAMKKNEKSILGIAKKINNEK